MNFGFNLQIMDCINFLKKISIMYTNGNWIFLTNSSWSYDSGRACSYKKIQCFDQ